MRDSFPLPFAKRHWFNAAPPRLGSLSSLTHFYSTPLASCCAVLLNRLLRVILIQELGAGRKMSWEAAIRMVWRTGEF